MVIELSADLVWFKGKFQRGLKILFSQDDGKIISVMNNEEGNGSKITVDKVIAFPGKAVLPGFVSAHSHAFQRNLRGLGEKYQMGNQDSFWTWRNDMYKLVDRIKDEETFFKVTCKCFQEMKDSGITSVGEFHYFHHPYGISDNARYSFDEQVIKAAEKVGIRLVLLNAFYHFGGFRKAPLSESQKRFETKSCEEYWVQMDKLEEKINDKSLVSLGVVAHSLRAVSQEQLIQLFNEAKKRGYPFHLHIEEQPKEVEECKTAYGGKTPMEVLLDSIQVDKLTTAVHCNHTNVEHLKIFSSKGGNVCICPLTEGNLGDGVMKDFAACSSNVCLGTDCNARIDLIEEARWLEYSQRLQKLSRGVTTKSNCKNDNENDIDAGEKLFSFMTRNGARSLGLDCGEIEQGKFADFALVDLSHPVLDFGEETSIPIEDRLISAMIFGASGSSALISSTIVGGRW